MKNNTINHKETVFGSKMIRYLLLVLTFHFISCTSTKELHNHKSFIENFSNPKWIKKRIASKKAIKLNSKISEGSGLIAWNGNLWTHNDSGKASLFSLDTLTGRIVKEYKLEGIKNEDWEDLGQDENYFYIGAFGNNSNQKNILKIHKINKRDLLKGITNNDSITFSWPVTTDQYKRQKSNFDCEAMAVIGDSIYIFTKEWKNGHGSKVFSLPKKAGFYSAHYRTTLKTKVLITGANYNESKKKLVLCGYSILARPCIMVFLNADSSNLFGEKAFKIHPKKISLRQIEGIGSFDGTTYFVINEYFKFSSLHIPQRIHKFIIN